MKLLKDHKLVSLEKAIRNCTEEICVHTDKAIFIKLALRASKEMIDLLEELQEYKEWHKE